MWNGQQSKIRNTSKAQIKIDWCIMPKVNEMSWSPSWCFWKMGPLSLHPNSFVHQISFTQWARNGCWLLFGCYTWCLHFLSSAKQVTCRAATIFASNATPTQVWIQTPRMFSTPEQDRWTICVAMLLCALVWLCCFNLTLHGLSSRSETTFAIRIEPNVQQSLHGPWIKKLFVQLAEHD